MFDSRCQVKNKNFSKIFQPTFSLKNAILDAGCSIQDSRCESRATGGELVAALAMSANSGLTLLGFLAILSVQRGCS
jgi:hypothetical protein